jgi:hypothetical protein
MNIAVLSSQLIKLMWIVDIDHIFRQKICLLG